MELHLKTKNGEIWYLEHKRIEYDKKCILLAFGYIRMAQQGFGLDIPSDLKQI